MIGMSMGGKNVSQLSLMSLFEFADNLVGRFKFSYIDCDELFGLGLHKNVANIIRKELIKIEIRHQRMII